MYKILIVEDDPMIALAAQKYMRSWGYETKSVKDFKNVTGEYTAFEPHLVLMNISLPYYDGYHWCMKLRELSEVPILLAASGADKLSVMRALSVGGDDFVSKPFDWNVLLAKIQELLRRAYGSDTEPHMLEHRGALLNLADATLTYDGKKMELTRNDFRILQTLMENKGTVVTREALMAKLWETDSSVDENTLTVNVTRLRRKLEATGLLGFIRTKKGVGYMVE